MRRAFIASAVLGALAIVAFAQTEGGIDQASEPDGPPAVAAVPGQGIPQPAVPDDAAPSSRLHHFVPPAALQRPVTATAPQPQKPATGAEEVASAAPAPAIPAHDEADAHPSTDAHPAADAASAHSDPGAGKPAAPVIAAKTIFGAMATPAPMAARSIGFYSRGCLAGAVPVPIDGETWQVMRLSRNRNWGHPKLVALLERLAEDGAAKDGWPGLLVGDVSQPRGGPMLTGHASHQIGLDADVWLTPMPERRLSADEREKLAATTMLGKDGIHADPEVFTAHHAAIIRRAASYPEVERIFVHPGIKKAMCEEKGVDRTSFHKIRPYWGHHYHFHIRINCPPNSTGCRAQAPTPGEDGCGAEVDDWIKRLSRPAKPEPPPPVTTAKPRPPPRPVTLADLPADCSSVVAAGEQGLHPIVEKPAKGPRSAQHSR